MFLSLSLSLPSPLSKNEQIKFFFKKCVGEDVEQSKPCALLVGLQNGVGTMETSMKGPHKIKNRTTL